MLLCVLIELIDVEVKNSGACAMTLCYIHFLSFSEMFTTLAFRN